MSKITQFIDQKFYTNFQRNWDDELLRQKILSYLSPELIVLDLGAGAGIISQMNFIGLVTKVYGVDLDPRVMDNPYLDVAKLGDAERIPFDDNMFDIVFADNVLEHLDAPLKVFTEVRRVLRPGGKFIFKTPNKYHYMATIARFTPHRFHEFINKKRGRAGGDIFPTRYRANTKGDVSVLAAQANLDVVELRRIEGRPEYLRIWWPLYICGLIYERVVNLTNFLSLFRVLLIGVVGKPSDAILGQRKNGS